MRKQLVAALAATVMLGGCSSSTRPSPADAYVQNNTHTNTEQEQRDTTDNNWRISCTVDPVTTMRRCFAGTFGRKMSYSGIGYGSTGIPFQIFFYNSRGPYVSVGWHNFPGRTPTIRIDEDGPTDIKNDAVNLFKLQPEVVERLTTAHVVRARYYNWPKGAEDMIVDVSGFNEAWQRLSGLVQRSELSKPDGEGTAAVK